ncbi:MAG: RNA methyltransferase [Chloroflexota bacterium]|nr:RNA methyltransferase [Chloroflexota bacterium]
MEHPEASLLEGLIAVAAALDAASRPIQRLIIDRDRRDYETIKLVRAANAQTIPVERASAADIDARAAGKTHGGVIALVGERRFVSLDALLPDGRAAFVVMLDGVEDPYNFGQAVRAFYAAGADGLVVRPRNWMSAAGVVARASAGASERISTAVAETVQDAADFFRARGLRIAVAAKERAVSIYDADLSAPLFLVIGGEKRGVTRSFADEADMRLRIPYGRAFPHSLGTTPAAAALAFEIMRQRQKGRIED